MALNPFSILRTLPFPAAAAFMLTCISSFTHSAERGGGSYLIAVEKTDSFKEAVLSFDYQVSCNPNPKFLARLVTGFLHFNDRSIRLDFFESKNHLELSLGSFPVPTQLKVTLDENQDCTFSRYSSSVSDEPANPESSQISELALAHSPFLVVRDDQFDNRYTDLPLVTAYHVERTESGHTQIKYTVFFSDEDSKKYKRFGLLGTEGQMSRYGRRTDVEWIYMVELDEKKKVVRRLFQGGFSLISPAHDVGHSFQNFKGQYLAGSLHPILYNCANNNVFCDSPSKKQKKLGVMGYHMMPRTELEMPVAREWVMFEQPWTFKVSDLELKAEGKLDTASPDYLFVLVDGKIQGGAFAAKLTLTSGESFESGHGSSDMDRLGEDMWGQQAFTAIPMGREKISALVRGEIHGELSLVSTSTFGTARVRVNNLRFFRLIDLGHTYTSEEITRKIPGRVCSVSRIESTCQF